jgi:transcriptional regulator with XRE-family HTH domain
MVNTEDFIKRLEIILDYYSLNASTFADKIGVQRSSLSHLLSGRNKPSLDFILKIIDIFPDVDLYWILIGTGNFPKSDEITTPKNIVIPEELKWNTPTPTNQDFIPKDLLSEIKNPIEEKTFEPTKSENLKFQSEAVSDEVEKIVFFYKNGSFKIYVPN